MTEKDFLTKVNPLFLNSSQKTKRMEIINIESFHREQLESQQSVQGLNPNREHPILKQKDVSPCKITVKYTAADDWGYGLPIHVNRSSFTLEYPLLELSKEEDKFIEPTNLRLSDLKRRVKVPPMDSQPRSVSTDHTSGDIEEFVRVTNSVYKTTIDPKTFVSFYNSMKNTRLDLWSSKLTYPGLFSSNSWCHDQIERFLCDVDSRRAHVLVITGDSGTGKSQLVYTIAQKCKFDVFEINTSYDRTAQSIQSKFMEAIQSHHINMKKSLGNVILLDDVDVGDVSIPTIKKIIEESKHPIIFTSESTLKLQREGILFHEVNIKNNTSVTCVAEQICFLYSIALSQGYNLGLEELYTMCMYFGGDMRKIVTNIQFWCHRELMVDYVLGTISIMDEVVSDVKNDEVLDFWFRNVSWRDLKAYFPVIDMISQVDVHPEMIRFYSRRAFDVEPDQVTPGAILPLSSKYVVSNVSNQRIHKQRMDRLKELSFKASSPFDVQLDLYDFMFYVCVFEAKRKLGKTRFYHYLKTWVSETDIDFLNTFKLK
jgi:hypothetical protein